ncbi:MAG: ABC transporter ATP-binding protein [Parvibaculaceae bacterium]
MSSRDDRGHRIELRGISHSYGPIVALSNIALTIEPGELIALLGPSGCGKTTLLKIIAGFISPTVGGVIVGDEDIVRQSPADRNVGIVFQNYALFPHMTVARNVGYGLRARHVSGAAVEARVSEMLALVKMQNFAGRYPIELSGGQQQRVALARALAVKPRIMLLDEPFSALDRGLRLDMQIEVKNLLKNYGVTSILVTHDQEEALSMADRIVVLRDGKVEQIGTATALYDSPETLFVNRFLGQANLLPGRIETSGRPTAVVELDCGARLPVASRPDLAHDARVLVSVRPESLAVAAGPAAATIPARIKHVVPLGPTDVVELESSCGTALKVALRHRMGANDLRPGDHADLEIDDPAACRVFAAQDIDKQ